MTSDEEQERLRREVCNGRVPKDQGEYEKWYNEYCSKKSFEKVQEERRKHCLHGQIEYHNASGRSRCVWCGQFAD